MLEATVDQRPPSINREQRERVPPCGAGTLPAASTIVSRPSSPGGRERRERVPPVTQVREQRERVPARFSACRLPPCGAGTLPAASTLVSRPSSPEAANKESPDGRDEATKVDENTTPYPLQPRTKRAGRRGDFRLSGSRLASRRPLRTPRTLPLTRQPRRLRRRVFRSSPQQSTNERL